MSNVDMCHHDWPGTGCRECMRESHKVKVSQLEDRLLDEMESKMLAEAELHNAAELALKANSRIEELEQSLDWILTGFKSVFESKPVRDADEIICNIEKLLEKR